MEITVRLASNKDSLAQLLLHKAEPLNIDHVILPIPISNHRGSHTPMPSFRPRIRAAISVWTGSSQFGDFLEFVSVIEWSEANGRYSAYKSIRATLNSVLAGRTQLSVLAAPKPVDQDQDQLCVRKAQVPREGI